MKVDNDSMKKMLVYRRWIFCLFLISFSLIFFHRMSSAVVASELTGAFDVDAASLGVLSAAYFYPYALIQIPVGLLVDRYGPRTIVAGFLGLTGLASIMFGAAPTFQSALFSRILIGFGAGCVYIPALKMLSSWFRPKEFAALNGIMMAAGNLGAMAAAVPLAWLIYMVGWRGSFFIMGLFTLTLAVLDYLVIRNKPSDVGFSPPDGETTDEPQSTLAVGAALKSTLGSFHFWPLALWSFAIVGTLFAFQGLWAVPFLQEVYGYTNVEAGKMITMVPIGIILCAPAAGFLSDQVFHSRKVPALIGSLTFTMVWFVLAFFTERIAVLHFYFLFLAMGLSFGFFGVTFAQIKELFPIHIAGTVTSAYNVFGFMGAAFFQIMMGRIIASFPVALANDVAAQAYGSAFRFCFIAMLSANILLMISKETLKNN